jgi:hypothetical protein
MFGTFVKLWHYFQHLFYGGAEHRIRLDRIGKLTTIKSAACVPFGGHVARLRSGDLVRQILLPQLRGDAWISALAG